MSKSVSCKDVFLSWSKIVLLIYMCMGMTEKPKVGPTWILPGSSHVAFAMELILKCSCILLLPTWFIQSLCWRKCAPACPNCFTVGFSICSCCFPARHFSATWWDVSRNFAVHEGIGLRISWGVLFLFIKARENTQNLYLGREGTFVFKMHRYVVFLILLGLDLCLGVAWISKSLFKVKKENFKQHYHHKRFWLCFWNVELNNFSDQ